MISPCIHLGVIPILIGPLQILIAALPAIFLGLLSLITALTKPRVLMNLLKFLWRQKLAVAALVLLCFGLHYAFKFVRRAGAAPVAAAGGSGWLESRGGPLRQGRAPGQEGPARAGLVWGWRPEGKEAFLASPAVSGQRIYVVSAGLGVFDRSGMIYCLDKAAGKLVWSSAPSGYAPTFSSPVLNNDYLVCGEGLHKTRDARVVCLDLRPGKEGEVVWTFQTASHVECTPVIAGDRVVVGAGDDGYYCLKLDDGLNGQPEVLWHLAGEKYPDAETALAVSEGRVYAGLGVGGEALCVLDLDTGAELSRIATPSPVFTPPSVIGDSVYIGMGNGNLVEPASAVRERELARLRQAGAGADELESAGERLADGGEVWCIDKENFSVRWKYRCSSSVLSSICVSERDVVFVTRTGELVKLNHEGQLQHSVELGSTVLGAPAITDERVYVMTADGMLRVLALDGLRPLWAQQVGSGSVNTSSPVLDGGRLYVGTENRGVVCIGSKGRAEKPVWPGGLGGAGSAGNPQEADLAGVGEFLWSYPPEREGRDTNVWISAAPALLAGRLYVPFCKGRSGLTCLSENAAGNGEPVPLWHAHAPGGVGISPAITEERVFFVESALGALPGRLHAVSTSSGENIWLESMSDGASGAFSIDTNRIVIADLERGVSCWNHDGTRVWTRSIGSVSKDPLILDQIVIVATDEPSALLALDLPTGAELWRTALQKAVVSGPVAWHQKLFFYTKSSLGSLSIFDGAAESFQSPQTVREGDLMMRHGALAGVSDLGFIQAVFLEDGRLWTGPQAIAGVNPLPLRRGRVAVWGDKGISLLGLGVDAQPPVEWCDTDWLGAPSTPMILGERKIYAGVTGWGLVCFGEVE